MNSETHFNEIATKYDFWKKKNWYYYTNLITLYQSLIPKKASVLEIGCGTGDIIALLDASRAKGIDISSEMIEIAKKKHHTSAVVFERHDIYESTDVFDFNYIFLADVLEHVSNLPYFFEVLSRRTKKGTQVVISVANPLWEPLLMLAEKCNMKMPEGPHERLSIKTNEKIFEESGFLIIQKGFRLLIPKKIPGSDAINRIFYKNPFLVRLGFVVFWIIERK